MARCEDFPCCGHTDGLPCDWKAPTEWPHLGCDHNAGYCDEIEDNEDDDTGDMPSCQACWGPLQAIGGKWAHFLPEDDDHKPIYEMRNADA